jgi:hypothetical protein
MAAVQALDNAALGGIPGGTTDLGAIDMSGVSSGTLAPALPTAMIYEGFISDVKDEGIGVDGARKWRVFFTIVSPASVTMSGVSVPINGLLIMDTITISEKAMWKLKSLGEATGFYDHALHRLRAGTTMPHFKGHHVRVAIKNDEYPEGSGEMRNKITSYMAPTSPAQQPGTAPAAPAPMGVPTLPPM